MLKHSRAFTLLEILLVVGAVGILAAIVIVAINPQRQLGKARDAERQSEVTTLKDGIDQYSLNNNGQHPSEIEVNTFKEVCDTEAVDPSNCSSDHVDLSGVVPDYLSAIPRDPQASDTNEDTGYEVGKNKNGNIVVKAPNTEIDSAPKRAGTTLSVSYSLSNASYDNQSLDVSGEDTSPMGVAFNGDGTKMFMTGDSNDSVYSYNLSTAYDLGSASYNQSFNVGGESTLSKSLTFNGDGTKMFIIGNFDEKVYSYDLSTAYDLSSASYNQSFAISGEDGEPRGVVFNGDGTKMFIMGGYTESVYSYDLSTAYDLSSASYNQSFDVSGEDSESTDVTFNGNGTKMFIMGEANDSVNSYDVSTAYDLSTASYNQSFDVSGQERLSADLTFNGDGTKMFITGEYTDAVYRYSTAADN